MGMDFCSGFDGFPMEILDINGLIYPRPPCTLGRTGHQLPLIPPPHIQPHRPAPPLRSTCKHLDLLRHHVLPVLDLSQRHTAHSHLLIPHHNSDEELVVGFGGSEDDLLDPDGLQAAVAGDRGCAGLVVEGQAG
jgi:hypothetical protein